MALKRAWNKASYVYMRHSNLQQEQYSEFQLENQEEVGLNTWRRWEDNIKLVLTEKKSVSLWIGFSSTE